jgi:SAM-dependent methyltransferase
LPFGSVFSNLGSVYLTQYTVQTNKDETVRFQNNVLTRLGFKILGVPHIGIRLRASHIFKDIPSDVTNLLDAGTGTGIYSFSLSHRIGSIDAIDNQKDKIDYLRETNPFKNISFHVMDLTKLQFSDETFDLVICSDVIEHIEDDRAAFSEICRVLKKGGTLLMTVPHDSDSNRKANLRELDHKRPGYSWHEVRALCELNTLRISNVERYSYEIAERASKINYKLIENRLLLSLLFFPLYAIARITDSLFRVGQPSGIYFKIVKY